MYWLSRPPYLRWAFALTVLIISLASDLRPHPSAAHPFAIESIAAGSPVTLEAVEWRQIPTGVLEPVTLPAVAARPLVAGEPVLAESLGEPVQATPPGWWVVALDWYDVPAPGTSLRAVVAPRSEIGPPTIVEGVAVGSSGADGYGSTAVLVAVPPEAAPDLAVANRDGRVMLLVVPGK